MKLLLAATPLTGHLNPLLAVARVAAGRGDEVVVVTSEDARPKVEAAGFRCVAYANDHSAEYRETSLPVDVKLARMLVAANAHGCLREMIAIASFLGIFAFSAVISYTHVFARATRFDKICTRNCARSSGPTRPWLEARARARR